MSTHEPDQPQAEPSPEPEASEEPAPEGPRRLLRSRSDRVVAGVSGGLGRYFSVDPVFFRVGFVALALLGGIGLFLYFAAWLFVPSEDPSGGAPPPRSRARTIGAAVLLVAIGCLVLANVGIATDTFHFSFAPFGFLVLIVAAVWWLVWGRSRTSGGGGDAGRTLTRLAVALLVMLGSAVLFVASLWAAGIGGGVAMAVLVIAIGGLLVVAAVRGGGARWLILPALAIAAGLGVVSAADIDLRGGYGERTYAPSSVAQLDDRYDLAAGRLEVDLRRLQLPPGERRVDMEVGFGEAVLVVPRNVCIVPDADVGAGYLRVLGWDDGGFNVGWDDGAASRAARSLVVDAHVGMGALQVVHDPREADRHDRWDGRNRWRHLGGGDRSLGRNAACGVAGA